LTELHKYTLSVISNEECNKYYRSNFKLNAGINHLQLCAGDPIMDTCEGDSGGPLEIKLNANSKLIPFVVGITSFGSICNTQTPGVYTRISPYIEWIQEKVNETFDPLSKQVFQNCALILNINSLFKDVLFEILTIDRTILIPMFNTTIKSIA
jgi:secreted trypsin-like serine protease